MEEQKKYGIFRIEKIKLCDGGEAMGRLKHAFREFKNDSFDPELTEKNLSFQYSSAKEVMKAYKERVQSITTEKYKPPKKLSVFMSASLHLLLVQFQRSVNMNSLKRHISSCAEPSEKRMFWQEHPTRMRQLFILIGSLHRFSTQPVFFAELVKKRKMEPAGLSLSRSLTQHTGLEALH